MVDGCDEPKKSNPRRESPGLFCFGGAAGCDNFGAACALGISVVLGLTGGAGASSSNKLTDCRCAGAGRGPLDAARCDADRSSFAFSWTTAKGCSPKLVRNLGSAEPVVLTTSSSASPSRVDGSGIGPSITHLLDSYFVLIKFSIFLRFG